MLLIPTALLVNGAAIGRWSAVILPVALIGVYVLWLATEVGWGYEDVPEDWQAAVVLGLVMGTVASAAGVFLRRRQKR